MKNSSQIIRILHRFVLCFIGLLPFFGFSQITEKQLIQVEKMEYAYHNIFIETANGFAPNYNSRIILAIDDIVAEKMKQSILSAINNRWNSIILNPKWDVNSEFLLNKSQRFKTKLKKGIPGSWHLFFQVIDNGPYSIEDENSSLFRTFPPLESLDNAPYHLKIKALIVDGSNESVIFSNEMRIELQRTLIPVGQQLLRKVPALTDSFLQAFDSAVQNFFSNTPQKDLKLDVTPACLFLDIDKTLVNTQKKFNFITKNDSVIELLQFKKEWIIQSPNTKKTKRKNNFGNNLFNTSLTLLTGIETDKIREMGYQTTFGFKDVNEKSHYYCKIPFTEERREGKSREVSRDSYGNKSTGINLNGESNVSRLFDPKQIIYLVREKDTIGSFKITIGNSLNYKNSSQCWDGKNESTITDMPESWLNNTSEQNRDIIPYLLEGELYNTPFAIEKSKAGNQVDITIKDQEIATLKTYNNKPVLGLLYSLPTDEKVFYVLMMLSTMPFNSIL